jgi:hypothetical protein
MEKIKYFLTIIIIIIFLPVISASDFLCGDLNGDGSINILDITYLIAYLYQGGPPPVIIHVADVNGNYRVDILDITCLISYLYMSGSDLNCPPVPNPQFELTDSSDCVNMKGFTAADPVPFDSSCVEYEYDGIGTLVLNHRNAGLNCCAIFVAYGGVGSNTIYIVEIDSVLGDPCPCQCLYDLSFRFEYLPPGVYTVDISEPLVNPSNMETIEFEVDLTGPTSGKHCVYRDDYPWGEW